MRCKIESCGSDAVAGGMCMMHYMRVRRTGNPTIKGKPGPKPGPKPVVLSAAEASEVAALRQELVVLRQENATLARERVTLRRQLAQARTAKPKRATQPKRPATVDETEARLQAVREDNRQLRARLKRFAETEKGVLVISAANVRRIRR